MMTSGYRLENVVLTIDEIGELCAVSRNAIQKRLGDGTPLFAVRMRA